LTIPNVVPETLPEAAGGEFTFSWSNYTVQGGRTKVLMAAIHLFSDEFFPLFALMWDFPIKP
jgi:hypothetical protein